jgi:hypothetical protein
VHDTKWHIIAGSPDRQRCQSVQPAAPRKTSLPANANLQRAAFCVRHRLGNGPRPVANGRQRRTSGAKAPSAECITQLLGARMLDHAPRGLTNHEIAEKLGLKVGTIKHYMTKVFRKMKASNGVQAILASQTISDEHGVRPVPN